MASAPNERNSEIFAGTFSAIETGNWFQVNTNRENVPLQISFGTGTGGTVAVQGRNGPSDDPVVITSQTADYGALAVAWPQMRVDLTGTPSSRVITVTVGHATLKDTGA